MRQPPSVFSARVLRLAASEPVSGSVKPKHPRLSPEHSRGSQACFCSSVPQRWIDDQGVGAVVEPAAAVLLAHDRAEVAHPAELAHELQVEALVAGVLAPDGE